MGIQDTELNLSLHFIPRAVQEGTPKASSGFQTLHAAIMLAVTLFFPLDFFYFSSNITDRNNLPYKH